MERETALLVGDFILVLGILPALYFIVDYGVRRPLLGFVPWWRSAIGWMFIVVAFGFIANDSATLLTIFLGPDYLGREIVRIAAFSFSAIASISLAVVYVREKRLHGTHFVLRHEEEPPEADPPAV